MRRAMFTSVMMTGLVLGTAAPAVAAPPEMEKQSGSYESLYSFSSSCTSGSRSVCTDISLSASTDTSGFGETCVTIDTYSVNRGRYTPISSESGCTAGADTLTVRDDLTAVLARTTVTLESYDCGRQDCVVSGSRDVVVSAQDKPVGPVSTATGRGTFTSDGCVFRFSYSETFAEVAGTITLDGVTYDESGSVNKGDYRTTSRCK